jgi:hypothetical protein
VVDQAVGDPGPAIPGRAGRFGDPLPVRGLHQRILPRRRPPIWRDSGAPTGVRLSAEIREDLCANSCPRGLPGARKYSIGAIWDPCRTNRCLRPVTAARAALLGPAIRPPHLGQQALARAWAQFWSHSSPSAAVHRWSVGSCSRSSRTVADAGERWSTLLESAWQPLRSSNLLSSAALTCKSTSPGGRRAGVLCSRGLILVVLIMSRRWCHRQDRPQLLAWSQAS